MLSTLKTEQIYRFNPRTHVGCDLISVILYNVCNMFQSTHPRRVRRYYIHYLHPGTQGFNPRTHVGCDSKSGHCSAQKVSFNPRTHVGCDSNHLSASFVIIRFNPRTHVGCDLTWKLEIMFFRRFNPRTHVGCDLEWWCYHMV